MTREYGVEELDGAPLLFCVLVWYTGRSTSVTSLVLWGCV